MIQYLNNKSEKGKYDIAHTQNLKNKVQMNLFKKQKQTHKKIDLSKIDIENKLQIVKGASGEGIKWEIGVDMQTLLYITLVTNKNLLYSTKTSTQCSAMTDLGKNLQKSGYVYVCMYVCVCVCL